MITIMIMIILLLYITSNQKIENFQYFLKDNKYQPYAFVDIGKDQTMLTIDVENDASCENMCITTPRCDGFNYFQGKCTLYKNFKNVPLEVKTYYRYW